MRLDGDDDRCRVTRPPRVRNQDRSVRAKDDRHSPDLVGPVHPEWRLGPRQALTRRVVIATVETQNAGHTAWPAGAVSEMARHSRCRQVPRTDQYGCNYNESSYASHPRELRR
jgi:hypothetical protein